MSVISEEKQRSERSQIFNFNSGKSKTAQSVKKSSVVSVVRYFILMVLKVKQRSECSQGRKTAL